MNPQHFTGEGDAGSEIGIRAKPSYQFLSKLTGTLGSPILQEESQVHCFAFYVQFYLKTARLIIVERRKVISHSTETLDLQEFHDQHPRDVWIFHITF